MDDKYHVTLNEPILVEEGVKWFKELVDNLEAAKFEKNPKMDSLALAVHALMLELGFKTESDKSIPDNWKTSAGHVTRYHYPPSEEKDIVLMVTSLGPLVKIHGTHSASKNTFSTSKIKSADFTLEKDGKTELKNVSHLARMFKNEVGVPLLDTVKSHLGLPTNGLLGLPPELSLNILKYLDLKSLLRLGQSSKQLKPLVKDQNIWKRLYLRDFGMRSSVIKKFMNSLNHQETEDWFRLYKEEFLNRKEQEESRARLPQPPLFPFPDLGNNPDVPLGPPLPPGIVGGDYDRIPLGGRDPLRNPFSLPRPRFDPPGPNFPGFGPGRGGFGSSGFGGGGMGFM